MPLLSHSLGRSSSPVAGIAIDPITGLLTYQSEASPRSKTVTATITVTDNGIPAASSQRQMTFILQASGQTNRAPIAHRIAETVIVKGATTGEIDIRSAFTDPDGASDIDSIVLSANNNPALVLSTHLSRVENKLRFILDPAIVGTSLLTLTATDASGLTAENALSIRIVEAADDDRDGLTNAEEFTYRTNPEIADTDGDGLKDGIEVSLGSDPSVASSRLEHLDIADKDGIAALSSVAVKRLPSGTLKNSVSGGPSTAIVQAWLGSYEFTNRQWSAVLQHALLNMPGALAISADPRPLIRHNGMIICQLPTHTNAEPGALGSDEVTLDTRQLTFHVPISLADHPARGITWYGAYLATLVLNDVHGYTSKCLPDIWSYDRNLLGYYLPTDAEWEWAARSGASSLLYPTGNATPLSTQANFTNVVAKPSKVGSYKANALGFSDLGGNVNEWVFQDHATYSSRAYHRGGHFSSSFLDLKNSTRSDSAREAFAAGFRVALNDERKPVIGAQPTAQLALKGLPVTFAISASGAPPLTYQWLKNAKPIPSATNSTFTLTSAQLSDAATYACIVSNGIGKVTGTAATLAIVDGNATAVSAAIGGNAVLKAPAAGSGLAFAWSKNGTVLNDGPNTSGSRTATLALRKLSNLDAVPYTCTVTGPAQHRQHSMWFHHTHSPGPARDDGPFIATSYC